MIGLFRLPDYMRYLVKVIICTIPMVMVFGCARHGMVKIKDCAKETVVYDAKKILNKKGDYVPCVKTYNLQKELQSELKPIVGTWAVPIAEDSKGNRMYIFPRIDYLIDNEFEEYLYTLSHGKYIKNKFTVIIREFSINLTKQEITYRMLFFSKRKSSNVLSIDKTITLKDNQLKDLKNIDPYEYFDVDFSVYNNLLQSAIDTSLKHELNQRVGKFIKEYKLL